MKSKWWVMVFITMALIGIVTAVPSIRKEIKNMAGKFFQKSATGDIYYCPMHPSYQSDHPGDCPICNMRLVKKEKSQDGLGKMKEICRMHNCPMVHNGKPCPMLVVGAMGEAIECPVCGQHIQGEDEGMSDHGADHGVHGGAQNHQKHSLPSGYHRVELDEMKKGMLGLQFSKALMREVVKKVRATGRLEVDETRRFHVHPKVEGWVGKIFARFEGDRVQKGEPLFSFYSPDFVAAQDEYLLARKILQGLSPRAGSESRELAQSGVDSAKERLLAWDIDEEDLERIEKSGVSEKYLTLRSPIDGFVLTKHIYEGEYMERGGDFYHLADLSTLWAEAQVFEQDLTLIHVDQEASIQFVDQDRESVKAIVNFVSPIVREATRTALVRLEIQNTDFRLRPGMYMTAEIKVHLGSRLVVPVSGVIQTGDRNISFVRNSDGSLEPRRVKLGVQAGDVVEILEGVGEGEEVVVKGNFLIDSESQLKGAIENAASGEHHHGS